MKILFFFIILFLFTLFNPTDAKTISYDSKTYNMQMKPCKKQNDSNTYQIIYEEGLWWLFVYNADGLLIEKIPIDE